jgi:S1-C subfamily serine protease
VFPNRYIVDTCFAIVAMAWEEGQVGRTFVGNPLIQGTAFLIDCRGRFLTAAHVADGLRAEQFALVTLGKEPDGRTAWRFASSRELRGTQTSTSLS